MAILSSDPWYLFIDTETNGLPLKEKADVTDLDNWPRLVQFAFILYSRKGKLLSYGNFTIKPEGYIIDEESAQIHGITNRIALKQGVSLSIVLNLIKELYKCSFYLIGHNISFDEKVIGAELLRAGIGYSGKTKICTMESTVDLCCIESVNGYKFPKLSELYFTLFNEELDNSHDAGADVQATAKCFWELKRRELI